MNLLSSLIILPILQEIFRQKENMDFGFRKSELSPCFEPLLAV